MVFKELYVTLIVSTITGYRFDFRLNQLIQLFFCNRAVKEKFFGGAFKNIPAITR